MIKICPKCYETNNEKSNYCKKCKTFLSDLCVCSETQGEKIHYIRNKKLRIFYGITGLYLILLIISLIHINLERLMLYLIAFICYGIASYAFLVKDAIREFLWHSKHEEFVNIEQIELTEFSIFQFKLATVGCYILGALSLLISLVL